MLYDSFKDNNMKLFAKETGTTKPNILTTGTRGANLSVKETGTSKPNGSTISTKGGK